MSTSFSERSRGLLNSLLERYSGYFDVTKGEQAKIAGLEPEAAAHFYSRGEKYVLTKKAKLWGVECHEYAYFFIFEVFDEKAAQTLLEFAKRVEPIVVKPHNEHYYTYLTVVALAEVVTPGGKKAAKQSRFTKNYKFSLEGYSTYRLAVLNTSDMTVAYNAQGRSMKKLMNGFIKAL